MSRSAVVLLLVLAGCAGCSGSSNPAAAMQRVRALIAAGDTAEARVRLKSALSADSKLEEAHILLASIALADGDPRAAEIELSVLGSSGASTAEGAALGVRVALENNNLQLAAQRLKNGAAILSPKDAALLKADLLRRQNEAAQALLVLREAQSRLPRSDDIDLAIAVTSAAAGNLGRAIEGLNGLVGRNSAIKPDALLMRGGLLLRQGSTLLAIKDLRAALASATPAWPKSSRISTELILVESMLSIAQLASAREQLQHLNSTWPGLIAAEILGAQLDLAENRAGQAVARLTPLAKAIPDNYRLQFLLADALVQAGNTERATAILEELATRSGTNSQARLMLARLYMGKDRPDRVVKLLAGTPETDLGAGDSNKLLTSARVMQQQAVVRMYALARQLREAPQDQKLKAQLADAKIMNGDVDGAIELLGPIRKGPWIAEDAAARMAAQLAKGNEREVNSLVDRLLSDTPPPGADVLLAAANIAHRYGSPAAASRLMDRAAALRPGDTNISLLRASVAFDAGKYEEADKRLREIAPGDPAAVNVAVALARIAEAKGDVAGARDQLRVAMKKFPLSTEAALTLAALELRSNQPAQAKVVLDQFVAGKQGGAAANDAGTLLAQHGRMEEARSRFRQAVDAEPRNALWWHNLAQSQLALSDREAARESFVKSFDLRPDWLPTASAAVHLSLEKRDLVTAMRVASTSARLLPEESTSWQLRGMAELAAGRWAEADDSFGRSWGLRPSAESALGQFQARQQIKADKPEALLMRWLDRAPRDVGTRQVLASYYLAGGQSVAAKSQLELLLKESPSNEVALNNLAWLLKDTRPDLAEGYAAQAVALAPENAAVADTLGLVYSRRGKHDLAEAELARAAALAPDEPRIQYHLAVELHKAGKSVAAREPLQLALKSDRNFEERAEAVRLQEEIERSEHAPATGVR